MTTDAPQSLPWLNPYPAEDPRSLLKEYQAIYWADKSRFKIGLWSRQTGKDFTTSGEAVEDCFRAIADGRNGTSWMIAAPSERQSLETLDKCKEWTQGFGAVVDDYRETRDGNGSSQQVLKSAEITIALKNGSFRGKSKLRAVPGRPQTVRGMSANLILTEFDFFEEPDATWRAVLPSITNPLRGGEKVVRIITTPNGIGSACHKLWTKQGGKMQWSKHKVTIHDAARMGLPVDVEQLREMFADPEGWAQEFECEFLDTLSVLLGYELLATVENAMATTAVGADYWANSRKFPVDLGIDFGRKKDLTVCWANEDLGGFLMTREVLELEKMPTHLQLEHLSPRVKAARRVAFDYTGPGIGLGDELVRLFGEWNPAQHKFGKVELVTFTNTIKCEIFPAVRAAMEARKVGIPVSRTIREDFHAMARVVTAAGNMTYRAPHTEDGHSDRLTAYALALRAQSAAGAMAGQFLIVQP